MKFFKDIFLFFWESLKRATLSYKATEIENFPKMFRNSVFLQKQWFFEKKREFLKNAKSSSFALEWDWKIEKTQNFQNFCSLKENSCLFWKKSWKFLKTSKVSKLL